ncbi:hypothetical protein Tco_1263081 [Tanacetum coccineum]
MNAPLSPNHLFHFLVNEPTFEEEDPVMEVEEDFMEDPEEGQEEDPMKMRRTIVVVRVALHHQVPDSISIAGLQPRMTIVEEGVHTLTQEGELFANKLYETETQYLEMLDIVNNYPCGQVDALREEVDGLSGWRETMNQKVQTLEAAL